MIAYVFRRILIGIVLLWILSLLTFVVFYVLPSANPALLRAGHSPTPQLIASIERSYGLNKPVLTQYVDYMRDAFLHLNLGYSYASNESVRSLIFSRLPATISLTVGAMVIWLAVGVTVGVIAAVKKGGRFDRFAMGGTLLAIGAPPYWLGLLALFLFAKQIGKWQVFDGAGTYVPLTQDPFQWFTSLLLPWLVLAASFAGIYARFTRASMSEALDEDYIVTARAKGVPEWQVVVRHAARAAVTPIITLIGLDLGVLLGGAILVESVFDIPGIGRLSLTALQNGDMPIIQGTVLVAASFIIILNIVVDILYALLDPRVRYT